MGKTTKFLTKTLDEQAGRVTFTLGNGLKVSVGLGELPEVMRDRLALHGLSQKVGDASAGYAKAEDYRGAFGAMQGTVDNLLEGVWSVRGGSGTADLVTALAELQGLDTDVVEEAVGRMTEEQLAAVTKHPQVKVKIAEIRKARLELAAKASDVPDLGEMMSGLLGGGE